MSDGGAHARGLRPGAPLRGGLRAPGSKSIAQRALVCASLASGVTRLEGLPDGGDVGAAARLARAWGAALREPDDGRLELRGSPPGAHGGLTASGPLQVGESGTLARLVMAAMALCAAPGRSARIEAIGTLRRRGSAPLLASLRQAGARVGTGGWPLDVAGAPAPALLRISRPVSSQEVTALLVALAAWPGERVLEVEGSVPSRPYLAITRQVLEQFGACATERSVESGSRFDVEGPLRAPAAALTIEPDASLAAVALAAGCLSGGEVRAEGLGAGSAQGDVRVIEHLRAFGCEAGSDAGGLRASGRPRHGAQLDLTGEPDLAPVLAAVAAAAALQASGAAAWSELRGLETLPGKESSRIEVLARGLVDAGWRAEAGSDRLRVGPPREAPTGGVRLEAARDHRMAFAFALLGLLREGVDVADPGCVAKSWPGFWDDLRALGAGVASA